VAGFPTKLADALKQNLLQVLRLSVEQIEVTKCGLPFRFPLPTYRFNFQVENLHGADDPKGDLVLFLEVTQLPQRVMREDLDDRPSCLSIASSSCTFDEVGPDFVVRVAEGRVDSDGLLTLLDCLADATLKTVPRPRNVYASGGGTAPAILCRTRLRAQGHRGGGASAPAATTPVPGA